MVESVLVKAIREDILVICAGFKSLRHRQKHPLIYADEGVFRCLGVSWLSRFQSFLKGPDEPTWAFAAGHL